MTFRARPVVKRAQKPSWESRDRKNFYLNLGFGLVVVAALAILGIAVALVVLQRPPRRGRQRRRQVDLQGRAARPRAHRDMAARAGPEPDPHPGRGRLPDRDAVPAAAPARPAAARPGRPRSRSSGSSTTGSRPTSRRQEGVGRHRPRTSTPGCRGGDDPRDPPRLGHRGGARDRTAPPSRPPPRSQAARAKAEAALKDLAGGKAWEDVAKTVSTEPSTAAAGRRPGLAAGRGQPARRGVPRGRCSPPR